MLQERQVVAVALSVQVRARQREAPPVQGDARHAGLLRPHHQEQAVRPTGPRKACPGKNCYLVFAIFIYAPCIHLTDICIKGVFSH